MVIPGQTRNPPPLPTVYSGLNCNGPAGSACYGVDGENKRHNLDAQDRVALHKAGALWECAFNRGHLATPRLLTEAEILGAART